MLYFLQIGDFWCRIQAIELTNTLVELDALPNPHNDVISLAAAFRSVNSFRRAQTEIQKILDERTFADRKAASDTFRRLWLLQFRKSGRSPIPYLFSEFPSSGRSSSRSTCRLASGIAFCYAILTEYKLSGKLR
jgi:hypothetical protein